MRVFLWSFQPPHNCYALKRANVHIFCPSSKYKLVPWFRVKKVILTSFMRKQTLISEQMQLKLLKLIGPQVFWIKLYGNWERAGLSPYPGEDPEATIQRANFIASWFISAEMINPLKQVHWILGWELWSFLGVGSGNLLSCLLILPEALQSDPLPTATSNFTASPLISEAIQAKLQEFTGPVLQSLKFLDLQIL